MRGQRGKGGGETLRSTCMHAPCRARLRITAGPTPETWGPVAGERGSRLSRPSPPGSPAHSSISDLAGALGCSPAAESRRPQEQREALLTPGPFMRLRVVGRLGLLQRLVCTASASHPASGHRGRPAAPTLSKWLPNHWVLWPHREPGKGRGLRRPHLLRMCPQEPVKALMTTHVSGAALASGDGSENTIRVLLLR